MPNAYFWWQGGREGGQKSQKPAYVIHGCSLVKTTSIIKNIHSYIPILLTVGETNKMTKSFSWKKLIFIWSNIFKHSTVNNDYQSDSFDKFGCTLLLLACHPWFANLTKFRSTKSWILRNNFFNIQNWDSQNRAETAAWK